MSKPDRLEKSYAEALASLGDAKNICGPLEEIAQILLRNLESRIEWKIQDAAAQKQRQPVSLTAEMAELEHIGRTCTILQDSRFDGYRTGDPDAGAKAIVRILELARREYEGNEQKINKTTEGAEDITKKAPKNKKDVDKEKEPDKTKQNPTVEGEDATGIERPPEPRPRIIGHGKVRRGNG